MRIYPLHSNYGVDESHSIAVTVWMNPKHSEWTEEYSVGNLPALKETVWAILQHREWTVDYSVGNQRALTVKVWAATGAPRTADSGPLSLCVLWQSSMLRR